MGLIKAALGSVGGVLADQWKEFFYCESIPANVLVTKGQKRTGNRSSNTKGEENIISNGSIIAVADGQCMCIVEQGKVVDTEIWWEGSGRGPNVPGLEDCKAFYESSNLIEYGQGQ